MRKGIVAVLVLGSLALPAWAAQNSSPEAQAPASPLAAEELQARLHMARKEYAEAAKAYSKLESEDRRNASYPNFVGLALMQEGDLGGARKAFERAAKVNKKFSDAYNNLGAVYYAQKQYKRAIREYNRAISLDPHVPGLYTNLGYAYFAQKQFAKATQAFQKAVALDPDIFTQNDRNGTLLTFRSVTDRGLFDFTLAKGYAENGDGVNCALYLRRALDEGYKLEVAKLRADPDFAKVLTAPEVKNLLDQLEPPPAAPQPPPAF